MLLHNVETVAVKFYASVRGNERADKLAGMVPVENGRAIDRTDILKAQIKGIEAGITLEVHT